MDPDEDVLPDPEEFIPDASVAAAEALARARAMARARGLRPGTPAKRTAVTGAGRDPRDGRDPALLGEVVERLITDRGWEHEVEVGGVIGRWEQIVGRELAAHAAPVTFTEGVLTIRAESTAWATQLRMLTNTLLARIEKEIGPGIVAELHIIGPSAPSWSHGRRSVTGGRGPRDTYG